MFSWRYDLKVALLCLVEFDRCRKDIFFSFVISMLFFITTLGDQTGRGNADNPGEKKWRERPMAETDLPDFVTTDRLTCLSFFA